MVVLRGQLALTTPGMIVFPMLLPQTFPPQEPVTKAMEVTVGAAGSAVLIMVCVVIDGSNVGVDVDMTVTVEPGAVTVSMLALSCGMLPMIAEIALVTDAKVEVDTVSRLKVGLADAVTVIVTGPIIDVAVRGPACSAVDCTGQPLLRCLSISYSRR